MVPTHLRGLSAHATEAEPDRRVAVDSERLRRAFTDTRELSRQLSALLRTEDHLLQSMPDASPVKWHLGHSAWFFDKFVLQRHGVQVQPDPQYDFIFNSYYNGLGPQYPRPQRGLLSRPDLQEMWHYRRAVDDALLQLLPALSEQELALVELGIHHEQQHQELIVTDIKHALSLNPLYPAIVEPAPITTAAHNLSFYEFPAGDYAVGATQGFCFDNETPRHKMFLQGFRLASRPATNGEFLAFIQDGGYKNFTWWLSEGWAWVQRENIRAPLYWHDIDSQWFQYTLGGLQPLHLDEPVCHINYYEANAFATWAGRRLPTEFEWEVAAAATRCDGHFLDCEKLHPQVASAPGTIGPQQMFGDVWEWTQSAYSPYPGFRPRAGAVSEYNGKFMVNQWVLRGGSCATPCGHIRASYRNFFPVNASWQFSGVRLADDID